VPALHIADVSPRRLARRNRPSRCQPENIILAADGSAKLIDFGLAIIRGQENPAAHGEQMLHPRVGTVAYMAPEQARNAVNVDHRADMYSLGATLYHAVTGRLPFTGNSAAQIMLRHIEDEPIPPCAIVPVPEALSDLILKLMCKNPDDRYNEAGDLIAALRTGTSY
jgi:serine/threonine protein kinase